MTSRPKPTARERNRARIVDAARRLWFEDPNASMDAVAEEAGVVRRTLYSHFATREELVVAVVVHAADFIDDVPVDGDPAVRLAALCWHLWGAGSELRLLVVATAQHDGGAVAQVLDRLDQTMAAIIADGQRSGVFSDHLPPEVMARAMGASAAALHDEGTSGRWRGTPTEVATAALVAAGVPPERARVLGRRDT